MAICPMAKVMIVSHRSEAPELLEALQQAAICQILNASQAQVNKTWPDLTAGSAGPREIEELPGRLTRTAAFLKNYADGPKGLAAIFSPRAVVAEQLYRSTVSDHALLQIVEQTEQTEKSIEQLTGEIERCSAIIDKLRPWTSLQTPVEELTRLRTTNCLTGLLPYPHLESVCEQLGELTAAVEPVGISANTAACLVVCLSENLAEVQKRLRAAEFEPVSFEGMSGTVGELITRRRQELDETSRQLQSEHARAAKLSENLLKIEILCDHYSNLLKRHRTETEAPATTATVILEGWVKKKNYGRLEKIVSQFGASSVSKIEPGEDEEIPVEIENARPVRPFEVITRLYGMPHHLNVDPTACLAPFFAFFFALCMADVGYGLVMAAVIVWLLIKLQGDKKMLWLFLICAGVTIPLGAITGGWFGDAISRFVPSLNPVKAKLMLFDPMEQPMVLFGLSVVLGYIQLMTGLVIALARNLKYKDFIAAVCDQLTWLVMLNSIAVLGLSKAGMIPAEAGSFSGKLAMVPAAAILLFSHRQGSWKARIGMGAYNLFSAVFYLGDILSYLRLMALCMVGGGIAMSVNIIAEISLGIPYVGIVIMILVLVFGHALNLVLSALGAFVHTLRLQYVEYFTKFFVSGGKLFEPLEKKYKHIYIKSFEARL